MLGFTSYKLTLLYYNEFGAPKDDKVAGLINELYGEIEVADVSKNLIYAVGEENEIKAVVLEIFNTNTNNMDYITIPMKAKFTISNELYQKLCASGSGAPQIMKVSRMSNYFNDATLYEYGVIMLEDLFDIDINYYTAVPVDLFKKMFKQRDAASAEAGDGTPMQSYYEWHLKESYLKEITGLKDKDLERYIKERVNASKSNLSLRSKLEYVPNYEKVNTKLIYTHSLYGRMENLDFEVNVEESNRLLQRILENASYTTEQKNAKPASETKTSLGYNIEILNASQITGLAAQYEEKLVQDGYTVSSIGNYTGVVAAQTRIIVKEEGFGTDLLTYFAGAVIEKGDLTGDYQIQIILGTDAKIDTN